MAPEDPTINPGYLTGHQRSIFNADDENKLTELRGTSERIDDHNGEVLTSAIDPSGQLLLSGGRDKLARICRVFTENDESKVMVMSGHNGPIMEVNFTKNGSHFFTCSGDKTIGYWDTCRGLRINKFESHTGYVNSVHGDVIFCSGSDDGRVRIWDARTKASVGSLDCEYRVFSTRLTAGRPHVAFAGADNDIHVWDYRRDSIVCSLRGHTAPITGIALSSDDNSLLSHSMDYTLQTWDIRPIAVSERRIAIFPANQEFAQRNLIRCDWSKTGDMIAAGCANEDEVVIFNANTRAEICKIKGHKDSVNSIIFHPSKPIVVTASTDKTMYISELKF